MSLREFDTLLANHPAEDAKAITVLEAVVINSLRRDKHTRFDISLIVHHLRSTQGTPAQAKRLLVELVRERAFQQLLFWECPNGGGPIFEASEVSIFPDTLHCDRCGQTHWFDIEDVEVGFVATDRLQDEVNLQRAP
jgi:hypothetical protein